MPLTSFGEATFRESKAGFGEALQLLSGQVHDMVARWAGLLEKRGFSQEERELLAGPELTAALQGFERLTFQHYRTLLIRLGEELARHEIPLERVVAAHDLLAEIGLSLLARKPGTNGRLQLAIARMHALAGELLVSGYARHVRDSVAALKANLREAHHRLLESSAYVTSVYERERRRISHDLHDEIGHDLIMLKMYLQAMAADLDSGKLREVRPRLEDALSVVSTAVDAIRRLVQDLGPTVLEDLGFLPAIKSYARRFSDRVGIHVSVWGTGVPPNIPMPHQVALYRILQGALSNVMKHAKARKVSVTLGNIDGSVVVMVIEDDGIGFDTSAVSARKSFGLTAMRERAEALKGRLFIQSNRAGLLAKHHGTRVEVYLPLSSAEKG